jgi:exoribonuclease-2
MNKTENQQREILEDIANRAMLERGLLPDFSNEAIAELGKIQAPATANIETARDLRDMTWASIDNDNSRGLDQLTLAVAMPDGKIKVMVAVADVDALVKKDQPLMSTHATIRPRFIPLPRCFPCFRKSFPPT